MEYKINTVTANSCEEFYQYVLDGYRLLSIEISDDIKNSLFDFINNRKDCDELVKTLILSECYEYCWGVEKDSEKSLKILLENEDKFNDARLFQAIGSFYYNKRDIKALDYFKKGAELGYYKSYLALGFIYENEDKKFNVTDLDKAIEYYLLYAEKGNADGYTRVAFILRESNIDEEKNNYNRYLDKAISLKNGWACRLKGLDFKNQYKADPNAIDKAIELFEKGSENGDNKCLNLLGKIYSETKYNRYDFDKAIKYYKQYGDNGYSDGYCGIGLCYKYRKSDNIQEDYKQAFKWFEIAASKNNEWGQRLLAFLYQDGKGVNKDINKAIEYFELAAKNKDDISAMQLEKIYSSGKYIPADYSKALKYLKYAADDLNSSKAQFKLGYDYLDDGGKVKKDISKAIFYLNKSLDNGDPVFEAALKLGHLYGDGDLVEKDVNKAEEYFNRIDKDNELFDDAQKAIRELHIAELSKKKDVFISWTMNKNNRDLKDVISKAIKNNGMSIWDCDESGSGEINKSCLKDIENSKVWVFVLTLDAVMNSQYIPQELKKVFDIANNDNASLKRCILPIWEKSAFDYVCKNTNSPYQPLIELIDNTYDDEEDIKNHSEQIANAVLERLSTRFIVEYKNVSKYNNSTFKPFISKSINNGFAYNNSILNVMDQCLYSFDPISNESVEYSVNDLNYIEKPLIICGERGIGKSILLQNWAYKKSENSLFFILDTHILLKKITNKLNDNSLDYRTFIIEELTEQVLKANNLISSNLKLKSLLGENFKCSESKDGENVYLCLDGFGEAYINPISRNELLKCTYEFYKSSNNCHLVFTTRNANDIKIISDELNEEILCLEMEHPSIDLYKDYFCDAIMRLKIINDNKNIDENVNEKSGNINKNNVDGENNSNYFSKYKDFISRIISITDDIMLKNPCMLYNFVYDALDYKENDFDLIYSFNKVQLIENEIEESKNVYSLDTKYMEDLKTAFELKNNLLQYFAISKARESNKDIVAIFEEYLLTNKDEDIRSSAHSISEKFANYLQARGIIKFNEFERYEFVIPEYLIYYSIYYIFDYFIQKETTIDLFDTSNKFILKHPFEDLFNLYENKITNKYLKKRMLYFFTAFFELLADEINKCTNDNTTEANDSNNNILFSFIDVVYEKAKNGNDAYIDLICNLHTNIIKRNSTLMDDSVKTHLSDVFNNINVKDLEEERL